MKVDMSPEAVTARLRLMGELCELSQKLMHSKRVENLVGQRDKGNESHIEENREDVPKSKIVA